MASEVPSRPIPDPLGATTAAEFVAQLNALRTWVGQPSLRQLRSLGGTATLPDGSIADALPLSTTSSLLNGRGLPRLPRLEFVEAFVTACLRARRKPSTEIQAQVERWADAWRQVAAATNGQAADGPPPSSNGPGPRVAGIGRNDLPRAAADFTGRTGELLRLSGMLDGGSSSAVSIGAIDGMAGVGKTTLAVQVAHQLADRYPDARLFIDLHAHTAGHLPTEPAVALGTLLRSLGVPGDRIPEDVEARAALFRAELADRRALLVLDNAASAAQVRPLIPGNPRCLVLVTSRRRLIDLESAHILSLDVLPRADAATMFNRIVGDERGIREPEAVDEVVRSCGYLPLAVRIAAARLGVRPEWTVGHLARRLRGTRSSLIEFAAGDRGVVTAFTLSYRHLSAAQKRIFRLLGLHPGVDFDAHVAAAMADVDPHTAGRLLEELVDFHLLQQHVADRYRFHDLLRAYAAQLCGDLDSDAHRGAALTRMFDYYARTASAAIAAVAPYARNRPAATSPAPVPQFNGYTEATAWLATEHTNLLVAALAAGQSSPVQGHQLTTALWRYLDTRGYHDDALTLHTHALRLARDSGNRVLEGEILTNLGSICWRVSRHEEALAHFENALGIHRDAGDRELEGRVLGSLAIVCGLMGRYDRCRDYLQQALAVARDIGDRYHECRALSTLGMLYERLGLWKEALVQLNRAMTIAGDIGHRDLEGYVLGTLGRCYDRLGRGQEALAHLSRALAVAKDNGDRALEGYALGSLGTLYRSMEQHERSIDHYRQALTLAREHGLRTQEADSLNCLGEATRAAGNPAEALGYHQQALAVANATGERDQLARAHNGVAEAHHDLHQPELAQHHWEQALRIFTEIGVPEAAAVQRRLNAR